MSVQGSGNVLFAGSDYNYSGTNTASRIVGGGEGAFPGTVTARFYRPSLKTSGGRFSLSGAVSFDSAVSQCSVSSGNVITIKATDAAGNTVTATVRRRTLIWG